MNGTVLALFIADPHQPGRTETASLQLAEEGIFGDKFFGKSPDRSILIASKSSYDMAEDAEIDIAYGELGENIVVDIHLYHLRAGDRIAIGECMLEITQNCTLCKSLTKVDKRLPKLLRDDRGIFAKTVKPGIINKGDEVKIL